MSLDIASLSWDDSSCHVRIDFGSTLPALTNDQIWAPEPVCRESCQATRPARTRHRPPAGLVVRFRRVDRPTVQWEQARWTSTTAAPTWLDVWSGRVADVGADHVVQLSRSGSRRYPASRPRSNSRRRPPGPETRSSRRDVPTSGPPTWPGIATSSANTSSRTGRLIRHNTSWLVASPVANRQRQMAARGVAEGVLFRRACSSASDPRAEFQRG